MLIEMNGNGCVVVRPLSLPEDEGNWHVLAVCDDRQEVAEFVKGYTELAKGYFTVDDLVYIGSHFSKAGSCPVSEELRPFLPRNIREYLGTNSEAPPESDPYNEVPPDLGPELGPGPDVMASRELDSGMTARGDDVVCDYCGRVLTWHEGAFSGYVHSQNIEENGRLLLECQSRREASAPPEPDPDVGNRVADDFDDLIRSSLRTEKERAADRERRERGTPGTLLRHPTDD